jgi:8-oxo-dGTP diphosphatase
MKTQRWTEVKFYKPEDVEDNLLKYAVIMVWCGGGWLFVRNVARETWEIPGGRREAGEKIVHTTERELMEETGASSFRLIPICVYSVNSDAGESFGFLFAADNLTLGNILQHEICEVKIFHDPPENLTYPAIQPLLFKKVTDVISRKS